MRLVLDTNIIVSAFIWGGIPYQLLELARKNHIELFTSSTLLDELSNVLAREKFSSMLISRDITPTFLMQHYGMLAKLIQPQPINRAISRDADDDAVIATALAAQADLIATGDNDLLTLHPYQNIQILNAAHSVQYIIN